MRCALIMAGGSGQRMARSGLSAPKPLIPVVGVPLLERNLYLLARAGIDYAFISVSAHAPAVREFVTDRLEPLGLSLGISVNVLVESEPLGNIGAAGLLAGFTDVLLVVYADNLTTMDLDEIYRTHIDQDADLTLAAHREPFRMPFGELHLDPADPGRVTDYVEKPIYNILVCSAVSVLGRAAIGALPDDRPTGLSDLARHLLAQGKRVRSWHHHAPWIDVNIVDSIPRAERLVLDHPDIFETWWRGACEPWLLALDDAGAVRHWAPLSAADSETSHSTLGAFDVVDVAGARVLRVYMHTLEQGEPVVIGGRESLLRNIKERANARRTRSNSEGSMPLAFEQVLMDQ